MKWCILSSLHCLVIIGICTSCSVCLLLFMAGPMVQARGEIISVQITGPKHPPGFFPAFTSLHVNDTIMFINHATPKNNYSVVAVDGSFASPAIATNQSWKVTFSSPGTHEYREGANPVQMVGVLLVVDANVALLPVPDPRIEATVLAIIKAQKPLPETPVLPRQKSQVQTPVATSPPFFLLFLVAAFGISCALVFLAIFYRRYRLQAVVAVEEENETSFGVRLIGHIFVFFAHVGPFMVEVGRKCKTRLRTRLQKLFQKREEDEEDRWEMKERKHRGRDEDEDL